MYGRLLTVVIAGVFANYSKELERLNASACKVYKCGELEDCQDASATLQAQACDEYRSTAINCWRGSAFGFWDKVCQDYAQQQINKITIRCYAENCLQLASLKVEVEIGWPKGNPKTGFQAYMFMCGRVQFTNKENEYGGDDVFLSYVQGGHGGGKVTEVALALASKGEGTTKQRKKWHAQTPTCDLTDNMLSKAAGAPASTTRVSEADASATTSGPGKKFEVHPVFPHGVPTGEYIDEFGPDLANVFYASTFAIQNDHIPIAEAVILWFDNHRHDPQVTAYMDKYADKHRRMQMSLVTITYVLPCIVEAQPVFPIAVLDKVPHVARPYFNEIQIACERNADPEELAKLLEKIEPKWIEPVPEFLPIFAFIKTRERRETLLDQVPRTRRDTVTSADLVQAEDKIEFKFNLDLNVNINIGDSGSINDSIDQEVSGDFKTSGWATAFAVWATTFAI